MKKSITWTPQSEEDAYETYQYIALDSVEAAEAYFDALFDTFDKLLEYPKNRSGDRGGERRTSWVAAHTGFFKISETLGFLLIKRKKHSHRTNTPQFSRY